MNVADNLGIKGDIDIYIDHKNGQKQELFYHNTLLQNGRVALARAITNQLTDFDIFIVRMLFGDGGTQGGVPKFVNVGRNGLFGLTLLSKPVITSIDPSIQTQAIFTSVITYDEVIGATLNEMALQMFNGQLFSMATFPDLNKTADVQITFSWKINFV